MARQVKQAQVEVGMQKADPRLLDEIRVGDWLHVELLDDGTQGLERGWITYYIQVGEHSGRVRIPPSNKTPVAVEWNATAPTEVARLRGSLRALRAALDSGAKRPALVQMVTEALAQPADPVRSART